MINLALGLRKRIGNWKNGLKNVCQPKGFTGPLADVRSVLILTTSDALKPSDALSKLKNEMLALSPRAKIKVVCHNKKKPPRTETESVSPLISADGTEYISDKDLGFWFGIKNATLTQILSETYDVAIMLTDTANVTTDFLAPYVKARLRVCASCSSLAQTGRFNFSLCHETKDGLGTMAKEIAENLKMMFPNKTDNK